MSFRFRSTIVYVCLLGLVAVSSLPAQDQKEGAPPRPPSIPLDKPLPAPPPPNTRDRFVKEDDFYIGFYAFKGFGNPFLGKGKSAGFEGPGDLKFDGNNQIAPYVLVAIPAGKGGSVQLSFFQTRGHGLHTNNADSVFWSVAYANGDLLETVYKLRNAKVSWNYLTYPFPASSGKFRLKTLWEVQFVDLKTRVFAPLKPTIDQDGNFVEVTGLGSKSLILPTLGLALEDRISPSLRWEIKASGMGYPGRSNIWDANAYLAYRHHSWELVVGAKGFHFRTTPKAEQYLQQTISGGYFGINWYL